jgi:hypothetical protein
MAAVVDRVDRSRQLSVHVIDLVYDLPLVPNLQELHVVDEQHDRVMQFDLGYGMPVP